MHPILTHRHAYMPWMLRIALPALLCFLSARSLLAQEMSARAAAAAFLESEVQHRVVIKDTLTDFRTELRPEGRFDVEHRILRAEYDVRERIRPNQSPEAAAREYLHQTASRFGIAGQVDQLEVIEVRYGRNTSHVTLQQVYKGVPVYNRVIKVNLDHEGQPTMVFNGFAPHVSRDLELDTRPAISGGDAANRVSAAGRNGPLETSEPQLAIYPSDTPRLVWVMKAHPPVGAAHWEVLVDAATGEIIQMVDLTVHAHRPVSPGAWEQASESLAKTEPAAAPSSYSAVAMVDGTGFVFDPDPLTTAGVKYGAPYVDGGDADIPELNAERIEVPLREISQSSDGLYRLDGPYVRIDGTCGNVTGYVEPAEESPDGFRYTRADDRFEAVNSYYHIDKSQRYIQALDVGFDIKNEPVRVNPHGYGDGDDSQYGRNCIFFGTGGIDDAEDADVIWHEYAHAVLDFTAPGILSGGEGRALHEGWADYWAASYSRFVSEDDDNVPPHEWWELYTWDGNFGGWQGRTLDHTGHYPDAVDYAGLTINYAKGVLWATTLMEIYDVLGRSVVDRLNLASHIYLAPGVTFADAAQAVIQADEDLYGGAHVTVLIDRFGERGFVEPSEYGPILTHEPIEATEELGGDVAIEVKAVGTSAAVDSVLVFYGDANSGFDRLVLTAQGNDIFAGNMPLPSEPGEVHYYLEALDVEGRRRRLPIGAPNETFSFTAGPDAVPPVIAHEAPLNVSVVGWPMDVYAEVSDNIGVDTVWVEYVIRSASGATKNEGTFGLEKTREGHFGRFPQTAHKVQEGESISYRIFARDISASGNITVSPVEGYYHVSIVEQGVLRAYDFEGLGQGVQGGELWQRGIPGYGLRVAHSGDYVWATNVLGAYPDSPATSSLLLPSVNLFGVGSSYLVFWHWYDFEHNGLAEPSVNNRSAGIWDGGNVKVSVDGGSTWTVAEPEGGYSGLISNRFGNQLGDQAAFGGYSYGWRREIVPLPSAEDVRVRFDFGSDDENRDQSLFFAGWYIDDISITTVYPEDAAAPTARALPEPRTVLIPGQEDTPRISVFVSDDTGIEAVLSQYRIITESGTQMGSIRLPMSTTDREVYAGSVVPPQSFEPGDRIEYSIMVRDFDANETRYPSSGETYVIDFRASQESNALSSVVSTGSWRRHGSTWIASGSPADPSVSSLVLQPFSLASNGETLTFVLDHRYELSGSGGGNVKISLDDGKTWTLIAPVGGYPDSFTSGEGHPMEGQGVFGGASAATDSFDLTAYAGREVRLRLDFASTDQAASGTGWFVQGAKYNALSPDDEFDTTYVLELHANFPDPFADRTTITYSIPERTPVRVSVYDMLGRRVALVRHVEQDAGIYTVQFDGSDLASGVYMLYLETTMGMKTEHMVVSK